MSNSYTPPKVWKWDSESGGRFASINRPIAGPTHDKELPVGKHPLQLYSLATPNGVKVTVMLEELGVPYETIFVDIGKGDQWTPAFEAVSPHHQIPAIRDPEGPGGEPIAIAESGAILMYLGRKFGRFYPQDDERRRVAVEQWLMFQMGGIGPMFGQYGFFAVFGGKDIEDPRPRERYRAESKRLLNVLEGRLKGRQFLMGEDYTIADIATYPWYGNVVLNNQYDAAEFLDVGTYKNVIRWAEQIDAREPVKRGRTVNAAGGPEDEHLYERHSAADVDKVVALRKERGTV